MPVKLVEIMIIFSFFERNKRWYSNMFWHEEFTIDEKWHNMLYIEFAYYVKLSVLLVVPSISIEI